MSKIKIKTAVTEEELDIVQDMTTYAFSPSPVAERDTSRRQYTNISKKYILMDDDKPMCTLDAIPMTQNVRGKIFEMQGIAGVATYPEARRKGYVSKIMLHSLKEAISNKQAFSTLYPFRESFYARFGYINFPQDRKMLFSPSNLRQLVDIETKGEVDRVLAKDNVDRAYNFLKSYQLMTHGLSLFIRQIARKWEKSDFWLCFVVLDAKDVGMMMYRTEGFEKSMHISGFFYNDSNAKYILMKYLSVHIDQFKEIAMRLFPGERPETWAYDMRLKICSRNWVPSPMGRVLHIERIAGMEVGTGEISIDIKDMQCDWNNRKWLFRSNNGILEISETDKAHISLTIQGLSALIYGVYQLDDFKFQGWGELTTAQMEELENLFPSTTPVLYELF